MIYLDNAATSPIDDEVLDAMLPYLKEEYGNPSSKYYLKAQNAKNAVEAAREKIADLIGSKSEEIIFTSGATESTNLIIKGYMDYSKYYKDGKNHIITSNAEHKATLNVCKYLNGDIYSNSDPTTSLFSSNKSVDRGYNATFLNVSCDGVVCEEDVHNAINEKTAMASFIYVNNEIGTRNNIGDFSKVCHAKGVRIHSDITQAIGKFPIEVNALNCDFLSASAHKIYGPKGVGFAYIKSDDYGIMPISALVHGGEQEGGIRAGTLAVHNIVGFGKAAEIAKRDLDKNAIKIDALDDYIKLCLNTCKDIGILNDNEYRVKGIVSILVNKKNFNNERFIKKISNNIAISTGSACSLGEPSHVISAIGQQKNVGKIIRISINKYSTKEDIDSLISALKAIPEE